jgi:hypothetical protein
MRLILLLAADLCQGIARIGHGVAYLGIGWSRGFLAVAAVFRQLAARLRGAR